MRLAALRLLDLSIFIVPAFALAMMPPVPSRLNVTTIAAANGKSILECWQLSAPFVQSSQAGTSGAVVAQLGETGATSYTLLPAQFDGGLHNAPTVQYDLRFCHYNAYASSTSTPPTPIRFPKNLEANPFFPGCTRWVAFISGLAVISLPNSTGIADIHGGRNGLILATDTRNVSTFGHRTVYPSKKETVRIQIPTRNNEIPAHSVLYTGPCKNAELDQ